MKKIKEDLKGKIRSGLSLLLSGLDVHSEIDKIGQQWKTVLTEHPFELEITHKSTMILFLGHPGATDASVDSLITYIRWVVKGWVESYAVHLRVIRLCTESSGKHNVYFEIQSPLGTFICGGCTDHSSAGKTGKRKLDGIFALLSATYDLTIEEATIPFPKSKEMEDSLKKRHWDWHSDTENLC